MIKNSEYYPEWQHHRINLILSKYPKEFFKGKRILELGPYNGFIGASFAELGAEVHCVEGRYDNVDSIKKNYPQVSVEWGNLDIPTWPYGKWDIIINFGLYYHLENFHNEHLVNCIDNCDLMFFESVIYNSMDSEIYFRNENGDYSTTSDQSVSLLGGSPSTSYVENIFKEQNVNFVKYTTDKLNGNGHTYNWSDTTIAAEKMYNSHYRRFWIVDKNNKINE